MDLYNIRQKLNMGIPLTKIELKVTDYARVSTDNEEQQSSLKNQIEHFDEMIKNNENWTYVQGYIDEGISGTTAQKRDNFMRMINDARNGMFDLIITKEISRFSRNTLDSIKYTRELLSYGVAILFVNDNINTALPDSELRLTIMASMAQDEIRRLSERVKFGMNRSIKNGIILGNNMLYGYKKDKNTGNLVIIPNEAEVIKRLFNLYTIDNYSIGKIVKLFNDQNIKTRLNKKWCTSTLTRMLKNPKYKGYYCGRKTEIIDYMTKKVKMVPESEWIVYEDSIKIPPIIDENLWTRANIRLKKRNITFGKDYKNNKEMYKSRYPLSAKIYCNNCNQIFHRRKQCKATNDITWCCSVYLKSGKSVCDSPNIRESEIYNIFSDIIKSLGIKLNNVSNILLNLYKKNNTQEIDNTLIDLKKTKNKIINKKDKLLELNIEGNLSNIEFSMKNKEYNNELYKIDKKIVNINKSKNILKENNKIKEIIDKKLNDSNIINYIINLLLDKIIVSKINNEKYNYRLKIVFNLSKQFTNNKNFFNKSYSFTRGYNIKGTKCFVVKYFVEAYIK